MERGQLDQGSLSESSDEPMAGEPRSGPRETTGHGRPRVAVFATLLLAAGFFAVFVHRFYPIHTWLCWRYGFAWLVVLGWLTACLSLGNLALVRLFSHTIPLRERLTFALPIGILAFGLAIFALGLLHALNTVTFFALPLAFLAAGAGLLRQTVRELLRGRRWVVALDLRAVPVLLLACLALAFIYFQQLDPAVFSVDVRWYHAPMAQRYALSHAIGPFKEGFWPGAWPQLLSYLYTWVFLMPKAILFDRLEICSHLEFVLLLVTLAQIPVFLRALLPEAKVGLTWTVLLAFPAIYLHDGNLHAGADHFAGFWALPIALAAHRTWHDFRPATALLSASLIGAAALTKYTAAPLAASALLVLTGRGAWLALRGCDRAGARRGLLVLLGGAAAITAPHWLKNWLWYGDPAYPLLRAYLPVHPWTPETTWKLATHQALNRPGALTAAGVWAALKATVTFSFIPNDWAQLHRNVPVFGSLFTLTLPCLLFVRQARRLWWVYAGSMVVVFGWYLLSHYDRYLQAILPAMAAATAGCLALCWRQGPLARLGVVLLVGLQIVWGGDVPFIRPHNEVLSEAPITVVSSFLARGFERKPNRFGLYEPLTSIGKTLPPDAVVLAHDIYKILGLDRNWVTDLGQSRISYGRLGSPAAIHAELRELGVTHLVWPTDSLTADTLASDLAFVNYAVRYGVGQKQLYGHTVAALPESAPTDNRSEHQVAYFSCGEPYPPGWYRLSALTLPPQNTSPQQRPERPLADGSVAEADLIVVDESCHQSWTPPPSFVATLRRRSERLYVRAPDGKP
jgi:hypothetical protein